ncbi:MAG: tRNA threonylcarbamoyladenosine dehydratase [Oscillospiraceae bacterium]|nr:tRNA threonylcarbamoyladenosine dehydratase [Oscillospiraceae bacterium]
MINTDNRFSRTELIFGKEAMDRLKNSRIAVFGIGGVGGYVVEALARSGVGALDIIDNDRVCATNINRQITATDDTIGMYKTDAAEKRIKSINPECIVRKHETFYMPETSGNFDFSQYDYIADAIDTVTGKIELAVNAENACVPIISSMGAGNKIDPSMLEVEDIYKTSVCPLARVMRHELKKRGIKHLKVVYSKEQPVKPCGGTESGAGRRSIPGSNAFVPPVAGLIMAGEIVKDIVFVQTGKK